MSMDWSAGAIPLESAFGITSMTMVAEPRIVRIPAISPAETLVRSCCCTVALRDCMKGTRR